MMKTKCTDLEMLAGHIGNTLSDKEKDAFESHLADCEDCRKFFVISNELVRDEGLSELEPIEGQKARAIWEKFQNPDSNGSGGGEKTGPTRATHKPELVPLFKKFYEWITLPLSELMILHPDSACAVRSGDGDESVSYIHFKRDFDDLQAEMFLTKGEEDTVNIQIGMIQDDKRAKNVRLTFIEDDGKVVSRVIKKEHESFNGLPFGSYRMILKQKGVEKGTLLFEINKEGIRERKDG